MAYAALLRRAGTLAWQEIVRGLISWPNWALKRTRRALRLAKALGVPANMTKRSRTLLWLGAVLSPVASFFAFWSGVFYAWMNASGSWSAERAAMWAYPCFALALVFLALFGWCVWRLIRLSNARLIGGR